jgi:hypothetical protein
LCKSLKCCRPWQFCPKSLNTSQTMAIYIDLCWILHALVSTHWIFSASCVLGLNLSPNTWRGQWKCCFNFDKNFLPLLLC